jgi:hypothetical protein
MDGADARARVDELLSVTVDATSAATKSATVTRRIRAGVSQDQRREAIHWRVPAAAEIAVIAQAEHIVRAG